MKSGFALLLLVGFVISGFTATTINSTNRFAYGANLGWLDWRGDTISGASIGEHVCSGFIYAANVGWIHLGTGTPTNGIQYQNLSAGDFGVNHDGLGNLRGYAYGANIGWINFETNGAAKVDLVTGKLSGSVYAANCGWISLSNAFAHVQTDAIQTGADTDSDGIADAWERLKFGNLTTANGTSDFDLDGFSDRNEYLADTNPNDAASRLIITAFSPSPGGTVPSLTWSSVLTRQYRIQKSLNLNPLVWLDSGLGLISPDGAITTRNFADTNAPMRFYRVQALRPLSP